MDRTLDEILALVTLQDTQLDSIRALITGLRQQVVNVVSKDGAFSAASQAKINAIFDKVEANSAEIGLALTANVNQVLP